MTMRFGDFLALDNVELKVRPGPSMRVLGENGAGKSTLVKCIMGYYARPKATSWSAVANRRSANPKGCPRARLGMVYQAFLRWCAMTVAENLVLARDDVRGGRLSKEKKELEAFLARMPFRCRQCKGLRHLRR